MVLNLARSYFGGSQRISGPQKHVPQVVSMIGDEVADSLLRPRYSMSDTMVPSCIYAHLQLPFDQVKTCNHLRYRMLDLQPCVPVHKNIVNIR